MALPVPYTSIITPIVIYPETNPPAVFNVEATEDLKGIIPAISSAIANELARKSSINEARTFTYNLVSFNNWQNSDYKELIQFTIDLMVLNLNKGYVISPYSEITNTVNQAISLWSSRKILQYPETRSLFSGQIIKACEDNSLILNNMLQEMQSMYSNNPNQQPTYGTMMDTPNGRMVFTQNGWQPVPPPQYQPQYQYPPNYNQPQFPQQQQPNNGMFVSSTPGVMQQADIGSSLDRRYGAAYGTNNNNRDVQFSSINRNNNPVVEPKENKPVVEEVLTAKNWFSSEMQPYREMYSKDLFDANYRRVNGHVIEIITPKGGTMDREAHKLHTVMGVAIDTQPRMSTLSIDVEALTMVSNVKTDSKVAIPANVSMMVTRGWILDLYVDSLILEARIKHMQCGKSIYRCFGNIIDPIPSRNKNQDILLEIGEASTFIEIATILGKHAAAVKESDLDVLMYLSELNKYFTKIINSFLKNNMSLDGLSIDSFGDDIYDIISYMKKNFGNSYVKSFELFELETIPSMYRNIIKEDIDSLFSQSLSTPDGIEFNAVMNNASVTVVSMTKEELDIFAEDTALLISESKSPILHDIAKSLFAQVKSLSYYPMDNYLVTENGDRFKLYKGYVGMDCYLISNA